MIQIYRQVYPTTSTAATSSFFFVFPSASWSLCLQCTKSVSTRGVDPYGTGGTRPPNIWTGGHYHECPPQYL